MKRAAARTAATICPTEPRKQFGNFLFGFSCLGEGAVGWLGTPLSGNAQIINHCPLRVEVRGRFSPRPLLGAGIILGEHELIGGRNNPTLFCYLYYPAHPIASLRAALFGCCHLNVESRKLHVNLNLKKAIRVRLPGRYSRKRPQS